VLEINTNEEISGGDVCGLLKSVLNDGEVRALAKEGSSRNTLLLLCHLSLDDNLPTNSSKTGRGAA
jgi:hypothetical protein